jgi:hypothetical protein
MATPKKTLLPEERFPIPESLSGLFQKKELNEKHLWVVGTLTRHITRQDEEAVDYDPHSYKPLYSVILKGILTSKYKTIFDSLKDLKLIEVELNADGGDTYDNSRGVSKRYRLTEALRKEVLKDQLITLPIQKQTLLKQIERSLVIAQERIFEEHSWVREELTALEYLRWDENGARAWLREVERSGQLNGKRVTNKQLINLEENIHGISKLFGNDKLIARISVKHGRLFNILTYCKKELRQFVTNSKGQPLKEIDMRSAQWLLLAYCMALATKHGYTTDLKQQLLKHVGESVSVLGAFGEHSPAKAFAMAVICQDLYRELAVLVKKESYTSQDLMAVTEEERNRIKKLLLKHVLYGYQTAQMKKAFTDIPQSDKSFLEVFYETYDDVILFCKSIAEDCKNRKPNGQISRSGCLSELLSTMEGDFFHNKLRKALKSYFLDTVGYFIVHDGIYVDPVATDSTHDIMKELAMKQFGAENLFSL